MGDPGATGNCFLELLGESEGLFIAILGVFSLGKKTLNCIRVVLKEIEGFLKGKH